MAILNFPDNRFKAIRFGLQANTQVFRAAFKKTSQQVLELPGALWVGTFSLTPRLRADYAPWQAFLTDLMGQAGTFFGFDPAATTPRGSNLFTSPGPQINSSGEVGVSITTDGWVVSETGLLLPGDYFEVNSEYKMVTQSVDSDSSGVATINFKPPLVNTPSLGDLIITNNPKVKMRLVDDDQSFWDLEPLLTRGFNFTGIEVFDV